MDPGTASCAAILIYIRGPNPSLNQGTTGICYLNDKRPRRDEEKEGAEGKVDKLIQISIQANTRDPEP